MKIEYLKEQIEKDWQKTKHLDNVGITVNHFKVEQLCNKILDKITRYCIEKDEVNDVYYVARVFLKRISTSKINIEELKKWESGKTSTNELKEILTKFAGYEDNDIKHFNAFCLIDNYTVIN